MAVPCLAELKFLGGAPAGGYGCRLTLLWMFSLLLRERRETERGEGGETERKTEGERQRQRTDRQKKTGLERHTDSVCACAHAYVCEREGEAGRQT